ncbi:chitin synthase-domain-containing protein [Pilobolus umbonatus]|nr:chitin synthase-domain-containing protein [Pilobolus umbonatus]
MRRTGIDQSILLSGKSEISNSILSHLVALSTHKKESKIQNQILHVQTVLNAFGHSRTAINPNASKFGKYLEIQFSDRGRMVGCKILNYLLDKKRITHTPKDEANFHVFYYLLSGASAEEKQALSLSSETYHPYLHSKTPPPSDEHIENFQALKASMRHLGLGKRTHARIMQLLAAILHLGLLQFVDDTATQEAAFIKNTETLDLVSGFLGVDPQALENALTYKTQLINKDITTLILNAEQAATQRDEMVRVLYSLLFTWIIEQINSKLCNEDVHNFIGILDLPGWAESTATDGSTCRMDAFCVNYMSERLHNYIQHYIFETSGKEYSEDGLDYPQVDYNSNTTCIELLDKARYGLIDIINSYSKRSSSSKGRVNNDVSMLETVVKYQTKNPAFHLKKDDTGASLFSIQHFSGEQTYSPDGFIESNRDALNADIVQLFKGSSDTPASTNVFMVKLFEDKSILTETHPKNDEAILNAQQANKPNRKPSTRRSKSTKHKNGMAGIMEEIDEKIKSGNKKPVIPVVLAQLRFALDELFVTLEETMPWFVFCIRPGYKNNTVGFDSQLVKKQVQCLGLDKIATRLQVGGLMNILTHSEFCERYSPIITSIGVEANRLPRAKCEATCTFFGWSDPNTAMIGDSKVFLSDHAWRYFEDSIRALEKDEQKKERDDQRKTVMAGKNITPNYQGDTMSQLSSGSNLELISGNGSEYSASGRNKLAATAAAAAGLPPPRVFKDNGRMSTYNGYDSEDQRSLVSEDFNQATHYDNESQIGSESYGSSASAYLEMKPIPHIVEQTNIPEEEHEPSRARKNWIGFVWFMTWWVPSPFMRWCGRMKRKDIQIAWREKLSLCMIIFFLCGFMIWFLAFFSKMICPRQEVFSQSELQSHNSNDNGYMAIRGEVFDLTSFAPRHWGNQVIPPAAILSYAGKDGSDLFPLQVSALCQGVNGSVSDYISLDFHFNLTDSASNFHDFRAWKADSRPDWYYNKMSYLRKNYKVGEMGFTKKDIYRQATNYVDMAGVQRMRTWAVLNESIYDLTYYVEGGRRINPPEDGSLFNDTGIDVDYMSLDIVELFRQKAGQDISKDWNDLALEPDVKERQLVCLRNLFFVGKVDQRNSAKCIFSEYLLLIVTIFLCLVIVFKFLAALQFGNKRDPGIHDKFVICQVPCYTESEDELKKTIDSIAVLKYDDKRKLLFIICDGMIVGGGNDKPTPRIVLDILGVDPDFDPEPLSFLSVGEGQKQHNMSRVYSGLYECRGHIVPYVVVVKVGKPSERQKPGNRGKRDSQLVLMKFLNKVHFGSPMTPMELEMYHQIKNIIGVNPSFYEYVLMVDADTEVMPDGLNRLVASFVHDAKIIGLCGETRISNEKDTWVTMIQVYEYFISHFMIKAFESLFGSVTCLPGCFCMYRIRSPTKNQPLLVSNAVIDDYSVNRVDTLHKKNLLHLGEDRYLTTLILKHFPTYKTKFVADAKCATNAPDQWPVLVSQRRRWINSTIHNLGELIFLPQLCGFCCFSMRFVVMLDLLSTLVQPALVGYLVYLIYTLATSTSGVPMMSIITIAGTYGLQAFIFILHRKWEHIVWMIVSIFAIPVFSFYIPIYSYWHFDDFSWGNTRVVLGDKGKKLIVGADEGKFDPSSIPTMSWDEYEEGLFNDPAQYMNDNASVGSKGSAYSKGSYNSYASYNSRGGYPIQQQQGSVYHNNASSVYSGNHNMASNQSTAGYPANNSNSSFMMNNQHTGMMGMPTMRTSMMPPMMGNTMPMMGNTMPMMGNTMPMMGNTMPIMGNTMPMMGNTMPPMMGNTMPPMNNHYSMMSGVNPQYTYNPSSPLHRHD